MDTLLDDLRHDLPSVADREVQSIFFGGGTPSLFAPESIQRFIEGVRRVLPLAKHAEITLEANPGTIERGRFSGYRKAGVTRVSLGVQSFDNHQLKVLGRIHEASHVFESVKELREAGFDNFNLDLMYGLPEQTLMQALDDLAQAIELGPTHVSHYQLTLEPGTVFFHRPPPLPDEEIVWDMQLACQSQLSLAAFEQYEVSGYAREGFRCRHNLNYWQFGDYLGLGAGAHGKLTDPARGQVVRTERLKQPREYLAQQNAESRLTRRAFVSSEELPFEFMLNALRLNDGFTREMFEARTGEDFGVNDMALRVALGKGLLEEHRGAAWQPTELGRRFLTDLQALFLSDSARLSSPTKSKVTT